ncbi:MAG: hypothetical protein RR140_02235 [Clostridia bacterium]
MIGETNGQLLIFFIFLLGGVFCGLMVGSSNFFNKIKRFKKIVQFAFDFFITFFSGSVFFLLSQIFVFGEIRFFYVLAFFTGMFLWLFVFKKLIFNKIINKIKNKKV